MPDKRYLYAIQKLVTRYKFGTGNGNYFLTPDTTIGQNLLTFRSSNVTMNRTLWI